MAQIVKIGEAANESEKKVFQHCKEHLPDDFVIYTNLELSGRTGYPYEFDAIMIGHHAVYSIEIKGYRGDIRGNARDWLLLSSGWVYKSPIPKENLKAKILKNHFQKVYAFLEDVYIQPLVVLSENPSSIDIDDELTKGKKRILLRLNELVTYCKNPQRLRTGKVPEKIPDDYKAQIREGIEKYFGPIRPNQVRDYLCQPGFIGHNDLYTSFMAEHPVYPSQRFFLKLYHLENFAKSKRLEKYKTWFFQDARALLKLEGHRNIVQAHPAFFWDDENTIVLPLKWIDGRSLQGLIEAGTPIALDDKIKIVHQTAQALAYSHEHGVIHRDVRPSNIIVLSTENVQEGEVKLVNFDCARIEDSDFGTISTLIGRQINLQYIAPEMRHNTKNSSPSSDQYALGSVFFELLSGKLPDADRAVAPTPEIPELSKSICDIINKMRHATKKKRYNSMQEIVEALIGIL